MFARRVYMHLKPNSVAEFTQKLNLEIIPLLRKQNGFQDEITFVSPGGKEAFALSLWDRAEDAEAYNRETYAGVAKIMKSPAIIAHAIPASAANEAVRSQGRRAAGLRGARGPRRVRP